MSDSYYDILGIPPQASEAEIKKAYRRLAKKYHPDVNPNDKNAEEKFKELNKAFEALGNKRKRALYDEFGAEAENFGFDEQKAQAYRTYKQNAAAGFGYGSHGAHNPSFDFESFFEQMLGRRASAHNTRPHRPHSANGPGFESSSTQEQPFGRRAPKKGMDFHMRMTLSLAEAVRGVERKIQMNGQSFDVKIPAGVDQGSQVRLAKQGAPGERGGPPGDLYIEVDVLPHPLVRREGNHLHMELPLTLREAALGAQVQVPTFTGPVTVSVPPNTPSGTRLRLRQKGVPPLKGGTPGNLYLIAQIQLPPLRDPTHIHALEHLETAYETPVRERLKL
ncbi:MAG: DnaJ domain-containing protein [Proteobacteria bacterium]|nr:DnaJ domain-containing protein [Cystobacterineae bacterium]MCL2258696.1 DnaJ domain-containing protein [Cystobacterineae bacterium]MCL2313894.1 DnaJ domain-containing protein [Pseudomonadota bacterium]